MRPRRSSVAFDSESSYRGDPLPTDAWFTDQPSSAESVDLAPSIETFDSVEQDEGTHRTKKNGRGAQVCLLCGSSVSRTAWPTGVGGRCTHAIITHFEVDNRALEQAIARLRRAQTELDAARNALAALSEKEVTAGRGQTESASPPGPPACTVCAAREEQDREEKWEAMRALLGSKTVRKQIAISERQTALPFAQSETLVAHTCEPPEPQTESVVATLDEPAESPRRRGRKRAVTTDG